MVDHGRPKTGIKWVSLMIEPSFDFSMDDSFPCQKTETVSFVMSIRDMVDE
jgi:hypothetical protein